MVVGSEGAAEQTGIPRRTIDYWKGLPAFAELCLKTRAEVEEQFWVAIQTGLAEVHKGLSTDQPLRDKVIALGVLWDKHALMTGQATSRTESKSITDELDDSERQRLRDWIDSLPGDPARAPG